MTNPDKEIKKIQLDLDDLMLSIDKTLDEDNVYDIERSIQEFNVNYDKIDDRYSRLKDEIDEQPEYEKPLINKLKMIQSDMSKCKKKINEKENKLDKIKRKNQYYNGELEGADRMKTEKEILLENQKNVDNQGLMINSIQQNVKEAGTNLLNINTELNSQGQKMNRIQDKVLETEEHVKKSGKIIGKMERRNFCMKVVTIIAIIVFGLLDITWIAFLVIRKINN